MPSQAAYTTREISLSSDLTLPLLPSSELDGEFRFDREYIQIKGYAAGGQHRQV